jgi:hypothetical protein
MPALTTAQTIRDGRAFDEVSDAVDEGLFARRSRPQVHKSDRLFSECSEIEGVGRRLRIRRREGQGTFPSI